MIPGISGFNSVVSFCIFSLCRVSAPSFLFFHGSILFLSFLLLLSRWQKWWLMFLFFLCYPQKYLTEVLYIFLKSLKLHSVSVLPSGKKRALANSTPSPPFSMLLLCRRAHLSFGQHTNSFLYRQALLNHVMMCLFTLASSVPILHQDVRFFLLKYVLE